MEQFIFLMFDNIKSKPVKRVMIILFYLLAAGMARGQVTSVIQDEQHRPIAFANVLFYSADTTFLAGTVSDKNGSFPVLQNKACALVKISMMGYYTQWLQIPLPSSIILKPSLNRLKGVTVTSSSPIRLNGSSLLVNVQTSPFKELGTAEDLLGKLPSVRVDNGIYSVFGKGVATIYVNNRRLRDNSELRWISPADIATVEIVRNPGAEYDADVPAVIKIRLKKAAFDGLGVRMSVYGQKGRRFSDTENVSLTYNANPVSLFFDASNSSNRMNTDQMNSSDIYARQALWHLDSDMPRWNSNYYDYTLTGGLDWQISKLHQIGTRWSYMDNTSRYGGATANTMYYKGMKYEALSAVTDTKSGYGQVTGNIFYAGEINSKLGLSFNADFVKKNTDDSATTLEWGEKTPKHANSNSGTADYTLWSGKLVSQWQVNDNSFMTFGGDGTIVDQERVNDNYDNNKQYDSSLLQSRDMNGALFVEGGFAFSTLKANLGLRYEAVRMDYHDRSSGESLLDKDYHRFYPNASLSMALGKVDMALSYISKVRRPSFYELRNGSEYFNHYMVTKGNPLLLPQYTSDLSYSMQYKRLHATVGWQHVKNYIQSENEIVNESPLNVLRRPVNMPAYTGIYANLAYDFYVGFWHPYFSANLAKTYYHVKKVSNDVPEPGKRPFMDFAFENWFRCGMWSFYADLLYSTNGYLREYQEHARVNLRIGIIKYFLKKSLYVSLQANNLLHSKEKEVSYNSNEVFSKKRYKDSQWVSLRIRYTLRYKKKYSGTSSAQTELERM